MVRVCPDYVPYHMVYKFGCWQGGDKELNDNEDMMIDKEPYTDDPDLGSNDDNTGLFEEEVLSEYYTKEIPFWHDNLCVLFRYNFLDEFIPNEKMSVNQSLNAIVRFSIYLFIIGFIFSRNSNLLLIPLVALIGTLYIKFYKEEEYMKKMNHQPDEKKKKFVYSKIEKPQQLEKPKIQAPQAPIIKNSNNRMDQIIKNSQNDSKYVEIQNLHVRKQHKMTPDEARYFQAYGPTGPNNDYESKEDKYERLDNIFNQNKTENFATADNKSDDYPQDIFKSVSEAYGDEIQKRNTLKTVIDPVCLIKGGPQAAIYGDNVQRRIYW